MHRAHIARCAALARALLLLLLLLCSGCGGAPDLAGAVSTLDDFHAAAAAADEARYFAHFDSQGVFVGTDATERWSVEAFRAYARPHFAKGKGWTYVPETRHVQFAVGGQVAWFHEQLRNEKYGQVRGSGVLVRHGDRWKIAQYVLSFPVPNEVTGQVVDLIRGASAAE